jgi:excinuclease ABC subunit B
MVPQGDQPQAIEEIVRRVADGEKYVTLLGVTGSGKTFTMAHAVQRLQRPTLVVSPNKTLAAQLVSEFRALFPNAAVEYFVSYFDYYQPEAYVPQIDLYIEKDSSVNEEIDRLRHRATQALLTRRDVLVVASVSCIYGLGSPDDYRESVVDLRVGQTVTRQELLEQLVHMKYQRNDVELKRGRFTVRGGTVDVMGAGETVHRIVLDGKTVAAIAELDPVTREERRDLEQLSVFPATHFLTVDARMREILPQIEKERDLRVKELLKAEKIVEAQRLKGRVDYDLEMLRETGYCNGVENYARYFSGRKAG